MGSHSGRLWLTETLMCAYISCSCVWSVCCCSGTSFWVQFWGERKMKKGMARKIKSIFIHAMLKIPFMGFTEFQYPDSSSASGLGHSFPNHLGSNPYLHPVSISVSPFLFHSALGGVPLRFCLRFHLHLTTIYPLVNGPSQKPQRPHQCFFSSSEASRPF